ncbi:MAG: tRNA threonylcarbamoyladenosine biosynthesis protein TsaB [Sulfurospirillum sp.]|nr:tRNA threonylcarbamoyladenosine biosynthesis protein TsaB [Sulfurospirillum sp.]
MIVSLQSPLKIGIYKQNQLVEVISSHEQTSEVLPKIFQSLLQKYKIQKIAFARGPGSFMAIKITYIFLRTLSITRGIELFACDGFYFSKNQPIKAMKKLYFVKEDDRITTKIFQEEIETEFFLPEVFEIEEFSKDIEPLYILPAV